MKKSIIALAIAGSALTPALAMADATLYGSLRLRLNDLDNQELNMDDNVSRIGIKGSTELFNGAKGIFQFEEAVSTAEGSFTGARLASIGVTGDFGTFNAGRQWSPFALWTVLPFHTGENSMSLTTAGYRAGTEAAPTFFHRLSNTIAYISPNMNGLQVAAVTITDNNANNEDLDAYNLAAKYAMGGLMVSASYIDSANTLDHTSVGATYTVDNLKVGARYATTDYDAAGTADVDQYSLIAQYTMGNTSLMANFVDHEGETSDEKQFSLEVQQKLGKQARAYVAYLGDESADGLEVGYRVDF